MGRPTRLSHLVTVVAVGLVVVTTATGNAVPLSAPNAARTELTSHLSCGALYPVLAGMTIAGCTHGPDPAPPGINSSVPRPLPGESSEPVAAVATALSPPRVPCYGDGQSGPRVQAIYAYPADKPNRYTTVAPNISRWAAEMDQVFDTSAHQTGGIRHVRFVTDDNCNLVILTVRLSSTGDDTFANTLTELRALGYNRSDRKYLVWMDSTVLCGIAGYYLDDQPGATNANNGGLPGNVARIDSGCWGLASQGESIEAHELMHTLGAVQATAPNSTLLGHCTDGADRMCYDDGSPGYTQRSVCPSSNEAYFDCHHDDYFSTQVAAGNYLATHWNTASSQFLATIDPPSTQPPPAPAPSSSPSSPSSSPTNALPGTPTTVIGAPPSRLRAVQPTRVLTAKSGALGPARSLDVTIAGRGGVPVDGAAAALLSVSNTDATANGSVTAYPTGDRQPASPSLRVIAHRTQSNLVVVPLGDHGRIRLTNATGTVHLTVDIVGWFDTDGTQAPGQYATTTPTTVLDTSRGVGAPRHPLAANSAVRVKVTGRGGVPTGGVQAVVVHLTAFNAKATGTVSAFRPNRTAPIATTLSYRAGAVASVVALVPVGSAGDIAIRNIGAQADLSADVVGWVDDGSGAARNRFAALAAHTLLNTRDGTGGTRGAVRSGQTVAMQVTGNGGVPTGVTAVMLTVFVDAAAHSGTLTCFASGVRRPSAASVSYTVGQGATLTVVVPVGSNGRVSVFNSGGPAYLRVDVVGYFAPTG